MNGRDRSVRFQVVAGGRRAGALALADEPTLELGAAVAPAPAPRTGLIVAGAMGGGVVLGAGAVLLGLGAAAAVVAGLLVGWSTASAPVEVAAAPEVVGVPMVVVVPAPAAEASAEVPAPVEATRSVASQPIEIVARAPAAPAPRRAPVGVASVPVVWWHTNPAATRPAVTEAPAAAPVAPAVPTSLRVTTDPPGAHVVVDGVWRGRTPSTLELAPGEHRVVVENGRSSGTFVVDGSGADRLCTAADGARFVATDCR